MGGNRKEMWIRRYLYSHQLGANITITHKVASFGISLPL